MGLLGRIFKGETYPLDGINIRDDGDSVYNAKEDCFVKDSSSMICTNTPPDSIKISGLFTKLGITTLERIKTLSC